jgi:hypothetical protein
MPQSYPCLDGTLRPFVPADEPARDLDLTVPGVVASGHGHASGRNPASRYLGGTIKLQYPHFLALGLDLGHCYPGTINVSIAPLSYRIVQPTFALRDVHWFAERQPEHFAFCRCRLLAEAGATDGYIYHPDPATKTRHYDNPSHLQLLLPFLPGLALGSLVRVLASSLEIEILAPS